MDGDDGVLPDLKDIETKVGRKVPESLIRSLVAGKHHEKHEATAAAPHLLSYKFRASSADLKRLESKMQFLKQEMAHLRAIDVRLMQQLLSINDGIESVRWLLEERGGAGGSADGSLAGSLYSLSDSQDGDGADSDGLDGLSVGSYLDTLAEDFPDEPSPPPPPLADVTDAAPLKRRVEADEYYCFG